MTTPTSPSVSSPASSPASSAVAVAGTLPRDPDYVPFIVAIPNSSSEANLLDLEPDVKLSTNLDYPRFSLGFHHYIHSNKNKMEILREFEGKKKVYLVMNKFERYIDNYNEDIGHVSAQYFGLEGPIPDILSRGFYKLWEILHMFDLIDLDQSGFVSAHLAEGPGSFIQATMFFRDRYSKRSKNDKYYAVTLHPDDDGKHVPELEKSFIEYYEKEKPRRFILHKTYSTQVAGGSPDRDNGDLTDPKTVRLFGGQLGTERADFVTADGGFDWGNENTQEQEAFRLIFAQIYTALRIQAKGGSFVCKFFETFTDTSLRFIYLLGQMYERIYLVKPLMSRPSNSEKYLVCMGFRYDVGDDDYKNIMGKLDRVTERLHANKPGAGAGAGVGTNLVGIWSQLELPADFIVTMIYCNTSIANRQLKSINEIVAFIKAQNYYGDVYQMRRQMQIDAAKYWIGKFLPPRDKFLDTLLDLRQMTDLIVQRNGDPKLLPKVDLQ